MSHAIVDIYADGEDAAIRANALRQQEWYVALSGPNDDGTDVHIEGSDNPDHYDGRWIVLASRTPIATG